MLEKDLETHFGIAIEALQQGDLPQAQSLLQDITRGWPDCKEAWYHRGELYQRLGDLPRAVEMYTRVLELDDGIQEVYFNLGMMAAQQQELQMATGYWGEALRINSQFHEARLQLALLLARSGEVLEAITQLRTLLQLAPEMAALLLHQARAALQQGQLLEASAFCQALRQGSSHESISVILIEVQVLHELGLDLEAGVLMQELAEPWGGVLRALYVPGHYASQAELEQARIRLDQALASPAPELPVSGELPRLRGWYLLERNQQVDAWLSGSKSPDLPKVNFRKDVQRLVWIIDAGCLPWQAACWQHLAALISRKWEVQLLLRQDSLNLLLEIPKLKSLKSVKLLPEELPEALNLLRQLQPDVLLYSNPALDGLQFWLAQERIAPVQLAWPTRWPDTEFSSEGQNQLDGQASLWLPLPEAEAAGQALLYPVPAYGWSPEDLAGLRELAQKAPLRLIATPAELGALQQLLLALQTPAPQYPVQATVWRSLNELSAVLRQSAALLISDQASPYEEASASCGLPWLPLGEPGTLDALASLPAAEGPDSDWLDRSRQNPPTEWAVTIQDRLARTWRQNI